MMNFIPILPLKAIIFPTEKLNLKLSGKATVSLVKDCMEQKKFFGILLKNKDAHFPVNMGTLCDATELVKTLKNGNIDVRITGLKVFKLLESGNPIIDKNYQGAIVNYPTEKAFKTNTATENLIVSEVKRLYKLMHLEKKFPEKAGNWLSFDFAHKIGFSLKQEYELLCIPSEIQRMEYIRRHLKAMEPIVLELEEMKKRIQMNGHFRNLS